MNINNKYVRYGLFALFTVIIVISLLYLFVFGKSKKLVCKGVIEDEYGTRHDVSLTLTYKDKLMGEEHVGLSSFNLEAAQKYAEEIGIDNYIKEITEWFEASVTSGKCE